MDILKGRIHFGLWVVTITNFESTRDELTLMWMYIMFGVWWVQCQPHNPMLWAFKLV